MLLAVDPGIEACGCALFVGHRLVRAALVSSHASTRSPIADRVKCMAVAVQDAFPDVTRLVIEYPISYSKKKFHKGPQQDLIPLAMVVGGLLLRFGVPSTLYLPYEWKRQLPKSVTRHRIEEKRLEPIELAAIELPADSLQHNVFDAIGVGLHDVGRSVY